MTNKDIANLVREKNELKMRLNVKKAEKRMYELRKKGMQSIETKTTATYDERTSSKNISDPTGKLVIKKIDKMEELQAVILELDCDIALFETRIIEIEYGFKILTHKEKVVLEGAILNPDLDLDELGRIVYYKEFGETRSDDTIARILKKAYKKLKCG